MSPLEVIVIIIHVVDMETVIIFVLISLTVTSQVGGFMFESVLERLLVLASELVKKL